MRVDPRALIEELAQALKDCLQDSHTRICLERGDPFKKITDCVACRRDLETLNKARAFLKETYASS